MNEFKIQKSILNQKTSNLKKYQSLILGRSSFWDLVKYELVIFLVSWLPGLLGLWLRARLYRLIIGQVGKGVVFGRNVTLRHPHKIVIGDNVIIDDDCVLDAKGDSNKGIIIGDGVYIGRNTIVYCKDGDIVLQDRVNMGHNCMVFSANRVDIGQETLIAAYTYIMSGGRYDYKIEKKIIDQSGYSKGPTRLGPNCWIGAKVVLSDGVSIGKGSVIGAGAVVLKDIPEKSIAFGTPAKVVKAIL